MKKKIKFLSDGSKYIGDLPLGCKLCRKGQKVVIFIGGYCDHPENCYWYCPISETRKNNNQMYADEIKVEGFDDIIREAKLIKAKGASITGGEPLFNNQQLELTLFYIEKLKQIFSKKFHIHLYTNGNNFNINIAKKLVDAGLDEIRFHPDEKNLQNIKYALNSGLDVGVEIPLIPTEKYKQYIWNLIDFLASNNADFLNLNEFEMNYMNSLELKKRGFKLVEGSIASVEGSIEMADVILRDFSKNDLYNLNIHFCSIQSKDSTQLKNRYKRRAQSIRFPYETITEDGTLVFIQIEGNQNQIKDLHRNLLGKLKISNNLINIEIKQEIAIINLPIQILNNKKFTQLINIYKLKIGIVEILPFHEGKTEICEYTPLNHLY